MTIAELETLRRPSAFARLDGALREFNDAGVLDAADVHVAQRLAELAGERRPGRGARRSRSPCEARGSGHVFIDLASIRETVGVEAEQRGGPRRAHLAGRRFVGGQARRQRPGRRRGERPRLEPAAEARRRAPVSRPLLAPGGRARRRPPDASRSARSQGVDDDVLKDGLGRLFPGRDRQPAGAGRRGGGAQPILGRRRRPGNGQDDHRREDRGPRLRAGRGRRERARPSSRSRLRPERRRRASRSRSERRALAVETAESVSGAAWRT